MSARPLSQRASSLSIGMMVGAGFIVLQFAAISAFMMKGPLEGGASAGLAAAPAAEAAPDPATVAPIAVAPIAVAPIAVVSTQAEEASPPGAAEPEPRAVVADDGASAPGAAAVAVDSDGIPLPPDAD